MREMLIAPTVVIIIIQRRFRARRVISVDRRREVAAVAYRATGRRPPDAPLADAARLARAQEDVIEVVRCGGGRGPRRLR